jgi:hypothetical protein
MFFENIFLECFEVAFLPLTIILTITAIKDLVEDLKRWRSDSKINKQMSEVYDKYVVDVKY